MTSEPETGRCTCSCVHGAPPVVVVAPAPPPAVVKAPEPRDNTAEVIAAVALVIALQGQQIRRRPSAGRRAVRAITAPWRAW